MVKIESIAGSSLHLILFVDHPPRRRALFWDALRTLAESAQLALTVVYNGQPYDFDLQFSRLNLKHFNSWSLPLRLEPEQILASLLERDLPAASARLWLQSESIWAAERLADWLLKLPDYQLLMPSALPIGSARDRRLFQALAPVLDQSAIDNIKLPSASLIRLPSCLFWASTEDQRLKTFVQKRDRLNVCVDAGCRIWTAPPPAATDCNLDCRLAENLWHSFKSEPALNQLYALLKRSPASARLYPFVSGLLPPEKALELLADGFRQGLLSPMMLKSAEELLIKTQQFQAAEACRAVLAARFGLGVLSESAVHTGWAKCLPWRESLSVCLIVRDEAELLRTCLQSVKGLADELIVVDTGSLDQTPAVAEAMGARVFHHTWPEDFSLARNWSLNYASSDWILVLDADEYLTPESRSKLLDLLWQAPPALPRLKLRIQNLSPTGEVSRVHFVARLFPNSSNLRYRNRIHESILLEGKGFSQSPSVPTISLKHVGYTDERIINRDKIRRNLDLLYQQQAEAPDEPKWMNYLADMLCASGLTETALDWYRQAFFVHSEQQEQLTFRNMPNPETYFNLLLQLRRPQELLELVERLESQLEMYPNIWYARAEAHLMLGQDSLARSCLRQCLNFAQDPEQLNGFAYKPEYIVALPLQQLVSLSASTWRGGKSSAELVQDLKQWLSGAYLTSSRLPHPLLFWAEAQDKGIKLPSIPERLRYTPMGLGVLSALALIKKEKRPELFWLQEIKPGLLEAVFETSVPETHIRSAFCRQLWSSGDVRAQCLVESWLYLSFMRSPQPEPLLLLVSLLKGSQQNERALALLQVARKGLPEQPILLSHEAMLLFDAGLPEQACSLLEYCLSLNPDFADAQAGLEGIRRWQQKRLG